MVDKIGTLCELKRQINVLNIKIMLCLQSLLFSHVRGHNLLKFES
jgi:hypothetical protein